MTHPGTAFPLTFAAKVLLVSVGATVPVLIIGRRLWVGMVLSRAPARPQIGFLSRSLPGVRRDGRRASPTGF